PPGAARGDLGRRRVPGTADDRRAHPPPAREARGRSGRSEADPDRSRGRLLLPGRIAPMELRWLIRVSREPGRCGRVMMGEARWLIDISRGPGRCERLRVCGGCGGCGCEPSSRFVLGRANTPGIDAPC